MIKIRTAVVWRGGRVSGKRARSEPSLTVQSPHSDNDLRDPIYSAQDERNDVARSSDDGLLMGIRVAVLDIRLYILAFTCMMCTAMKISRCSNRYT